MFFKILASFLLLGIFLISFFKVSPFCRVKNEKEKVVSQESFYENSDQLMNSFSEYLQKKKDFVNSLLSDPKVKNLSMSHVRRGFSFSDAHEARNAALQISFYNVDLKKDLQVRPVFDDYKPPMLWEKLLAFLGSEALILSGETDIAMDDQFAKLSEMLSLLTKNNSLSELKKPLTWNSVSLMGEEISLFWSPLYKKCPSRIREEKGIEQCVKGLFVAQIDIHNMVRDFVLDNRGKISGIAILDRTEGSEIEAVYPQELASDSQFSASVYKVMQSGLDRIEDLFDAPHLFFDSKKIPGVILAVRARP